MIKRTPPQFNIPSNVWFIGNYFSLYFFLSNRKNTKLSVQALFLSDTIDDVHFFLAFLFCNRLFDYIFLPTETENKYRKTTNSVWENPHYYYWLIISPLPGYYFSFCHLWADIKNDFNLGDIAKTRVPQITAGSYKPP